MPEAKIVSLNSNPTKPEPKGKFKAGQVVSLASGGYLMTVRKANKTAVVCDWTNEVGDLCTAEFLPDMMKEGDLSIDVEPEDGQPEA